MCFSLKTMTKAQLKSELEAKFYKVLFVNQAEESEVGYLLRIKEGILWYLVGVYENRDKVLIRRNIPIYCEVIGTIPKEQKGILNWEDLPEGNYFYGERMPEEHIIPELPKENPFKDLTGEIERIGKDYAVVKKFVRERDEAVEKRFLVTKKGGNFVEIPIREK